ncbi:class I SAM-dependent methyltransferase [Aureimonas leprariae]|uniref:Class I SAM-dependent methyltransferase n=1 Tax=Plantimonas leprariae TaxID=2615207 RepID=A0A7V7PNS0_9HYPH|nr:class I SAM-dependent methyltransferase [Aureimonas leprariae]KAB0679553.1 class I SAM-dependent methyltransferase [Aureimonas leprariae]
MLNDARYTGGSAVYGRPPADVVELDPDARQFSPLVPGSASLEEAPDASLERATVLAPPGTIERRFVLAQILRAAKPGASLAVLAPNDKGGRRIAADLEGFGCAVATESRRHHRIARLARPERPTGLAEAIAAGALRFDETLGLWTQAGVFSFDRIDPGTRLLLDSMPPLAGRGADLGCGIGVIGRAVLRSDKVSGFVSVDLDRRAVEAARRNIADPRAAFRWADLREDMSGLAELDFAVSNPPFHDGGAEDRVLGQAFIRRAAASLRRGGTLWLVANRHLPYEAVLAERFARVRLAAEAGGYKVFEARR